MRGIFYRIGIIAIAALAYLSPNFLEDRITIVRVRNKTDKVIGVGFFIDEKNILTVSHVIEPKGDVARIGDMDIFDEAGHWHSVKVVGIDTDSDIGVLNLTEKCNVKPRPVCRRIIGREDTKSREIFYSKNYGYSMLSLIIKPINLAYPIYMSGEILSFDLISGTSYGVSYILHDSAIIPGYSGSPLLDSNDCYVGINANVEVYNPKLSRAVSLYTINEVLPKLLKSGKVTMPFLGIVFEQTQNRVFISGAIKNSPAEFLGDYGVRILDRTDIKKTYPTHELISVNGTMVDRLNGVWRVLKLVLPGSPVTMVVRDQSGNIRVFEINSEDRFTMIRRFVPNVRFSQNSHISIL